MFADAVYGDVKPEVGSLIVPDNWPMGQRLEPGCDVADDSFGGCQFYLPTGRDFGVKHIAVDIAVTGKKIVRRGAWDAVRVRIVLIGDGEANSVMGGYLILG